MEELTAQSFISPGEMSAVAGGEDLGKVTMSLPVGKDIDGR